jgi:protein-S-isoprenylcysteine O-methyltransferase Ste14
MRGYWHGFSDANGDKVSRLQEGYLVLFFRIFIGGPYVASLIIFACEPSLLDFFTLPMPQVFQWIGFGLLVFALVLLNWIHMTLGKNFTDTVFIRREATLVTEGPYHYVRHPMYGAFFLLAVGFFLLSKNLFIGLTGLGLWYVLITLRLSIEEQKLRGTFGERWIAYAAKTAKLFPWQFKM